MLGAVQTFPCENLGSITLPPPGIMMIMQVKHRVILPHTKHNCVIGGTDVTVGGTVDIVVGGLVIFANILQQTRLPGHSPYRGFIIPSPEILTIPFGSHCDISTQMQFGNPVVGGFGDDEVGKIVGGIVERVVEGVVGEVVEGVVGKIVGGVVGVVGGAVGNVTEDVVGGIVGNVTEGVVGGVVEGVVGAVTFRG